MNWWPNEKSPFWWVFIFATVSATLMTAIKLGVSGELLVVCAQIGFTPAAMWGLWRLMGGCKINGKP